MGSIIQRLMQSIGKNCCKCVTNKNAQGFNDEGKFGLEAYNDKYYKIKREDDPKDDHLWIDILSQAS